MSDSALLILAAVAILMAKHAVADFYLQTTYQYMNKGTYGHPGGLIHAGIHVALTPLVYLVLAPVSILLALGIAVGEFLVHYHTDWLKEQINRRKGWTVNDHSFWSLLGTDQLVHGLTYLAIVGALVAYAG
jgi:ABC-type phosphate transport system permease subunit